LQCERRNQVEPRCAERWHLRDDEQFDLAAWFPSLKHSWSRVASFYIFLYLGKVNSAGSFILVAVMKLTYDEP
jgi:fucose permease